MRIHIGQISESLANNIGELEKRLQKFAPLNSKLQLRKKPFGDYYFTFIDMPDLDSKRYVALRSSLNGLTFLQSKLTVKEASRLSYEERSNSEDPSADKGERLNPSQLKRLCSAKSNSNGRIRDKREDKDLRQATFRVLINDRVRKPKFKKQRLWGVEKRPSEKLVARFDDESNQWRDGLDRTVDIIGKVSESERYSYLIDPVSTTYISDSDFEEFKENRKALPDQEFSDEELEIVPKSATAATGIPLPAIETESDAESEPRQDHESAAKLDDDQMQVESEVDGQAEKSNTEVLRSVLAVDTPFTLFGTAEEASESTDVKDIAQTKEDTFEREPRKLGLFFAHESSPYLRSQTQGAKINGKTLEIEEWEKEFWENRGEWNRTLRRRRREAARKQPKSRITV